MMRQCPSIFNDIIGPVMIGPSSSHTCGPARIGFLARQFLKYPLKNVAVEFAKDGAYTNMYKGQRSNLGFVSGLLGNRPDDPALRQAHAQAKEQGLSVEFKVCDFVPIVPNIAILHMEDRKGNKAVVHSDSTGGGTVKLLKYNEFDISIVGDCYELLLTVEGSEEAIQGCVNRAQELFSTNEAINVSVMGDKALINVKTRTPYPQALLQSMEAWQGVKNLIVVEPVLKVLSNRNATMPFKSCSELAQKAQNESKDLWELAVEYEIARSGWSQNEVMDYMIEMMEIMTSGIQEALGGDIQMHGIIEPTSGKIFEASKASQNWLDMGLLNIAVPWSMAVMEYSSAMGRVLCAPTGGSAGVLPGAILGIGMQKGYDSTLQAKAMLTAAIVGICMSKDYNYSAELYGCQVEPGAASAMAAAGLCFYMGATVKQCLDAASCGIQNILGTICDPVAGLVQVPCIGRNAMSTANALVSANIVMGGYDPCIPLDEAAETMFRVGRQLPSELRCTCNGGLCITPCGQKLAEEQKKRDELFM